MKQKNLILMVVAVGCGLVAAFLTTQINAQTEGRAGGGHCRGQGPGGRNHDDESRSAEADRPEEDSQGRAAAGVRHQRRGIAGHAA